jgi:hypothetical protein
MAWLTFNTLEKAQTSLQTINDNMGIPIPGNVTQTWADIYETVGGGWHYERPEERYMDGVEYDGESEEEPPRVYPEGEG